LGCTTDSSPRRKGKLSFTLLFTFLFKYPFHQMVFAGRPLILPFSGFRIPFGLLPYFRHHRLFNFIFASLLPFPPFLRRRARSLLLPQPSINCRQAPDSSSVVVCRDLFLFFFFFSARPPFFVFLSPSAARLRISDLAPLTKGVFFFFSSGSSPVTLPPVFRAGQVFLAFAPQVVLF